MASICVFGKLMSDFIGDQYSTGKDSLKTWLTIQSGSFANEIFPFLINDGSPIIKLHTQLVVSVKATSVIWVLIVKGMKYMIVAVIHA